MVQVISSLQTTGCEHQWNCVKWSFLDLQHSTGFRPRTDTLYVVHFPSWERSPSHMVYKSTFYANDVSAVCDIWSKSGNWWKAISARMTSCLADVRQWMVKNFMKLNDDKTEYLIISLPNMRNQDQLPWLPSSWQCMSVSPTVALPVTYGVYFDRSMKMD